jgi:SAM-dependent methyltransferase
MAKRGNTQARSGGTSDRYELYELSVQEPEADLDLAERVYRKHRGRAPRLLREDFCGTAALSCAWVKRNAANRAIGVDLNPGVLEWGRRHHAAALSASAAERVTLVEANVLDVHRPKVDLTLAMNFSYWVFKTRAELLRYFGSAHRALKPEGVLVLDAFGGSDAQALAEEKTEYPDEGFTYVWERAAFNPITNDSRRLLGRRRPGRRRQRHLPQAAQRGERRELDRVRRRGEVTLLRREREAVGCCVRGDI